MKKELREQFESIAQEAVDSKKRAGIICIAADDTGIIYDKCFGVADMATGAPITDDCILEVQSMTKFVSATALLQLVDQGLIDLDTDVSEYVPEFKDPLILYDFKDGVPYLRKAEKAITVRRLLSQSAGFGDNRMSPFTGMWSAKFGLGYAGKAPIFRPAIAESGEHWEYANVIDRVMYVLEAVTGEKWEDYIIEHIFKPLGMVNSTLHWTEEQLQRQVPMHFIQPDGTVESNTVLKDSSRDMWFGPNKEAPGCEAGSGMVTSGRDFMILMQMLMNGGTYNGVQILKPESVEEMRKNQVGDLCPSWNSPADDLPFETEISGFLGGNQQAKWGLGCLVNVEETPFGRKPNSMAWFGGADTYCFCDPESKLCGVLLMQTDERAAGSKYSVSLFQNFERMLHDLPLVTE